MTSPMFNCPKCNRVIGEIPRAGELVVLCSRCRYRFQVVRGRLTSHYARGAPMMRDGSRRLDGARIDWELHLELPGQQTESVEFQTMVHHDRVPTRAGDDVAVVYTVRHATREELLAVHNLTASTSLGLGTPGQNAQSMANGVGLLAALVIAIVSAVIGAPLIVSLLAGLASWMIARFVATRMLAPVHDFTEEELTRLERTEELLDQKLRLREQRARVLRELAERETTRQRLLALRAKMLDVGFDVYRHRIALVDEALATIDRQVAVDHQLRDGYTRSIAMVEIEQESGLARAVPDDATAMMLQRLEELRMLEESQAELRRELEANEEVERLLGGR